MKRFCNATINIDLSRLHRPLETVQARQYSVCRLILKDVPGELGGVFLRVLAADGSSYRDYAAVPTSDPDVWSVCVPALSFRETGTFIYELHAEADEGGKVALGRGYLEVRAFSEGGVAPVAGTKVSAGRLPTRDGGWVNCWAVMDETGEYTYEFERIDNEV